MPSAFDKDKTVSVFKPKSEEPRNVLLGGGGCEYGEVYLRNNKYNRSGLDLRHGFGPGSGVSKPGTSPKMFRFRVRVRPGHVDPDPVSGWTRPVAMPN